MYPICGKFSGLERLDQTYTGPVLVEVLPLHMYDRTRNSMAIANVISP